MRSGILGYIAPIKNVRGLGYTYSEADFRITNNPLTERDIEWLTDAVGILRQFKGFSHFYEVESLIYKLEEKINKNNKYGIQFDTLPDTAGLDWIEPVKQAINKEKVLEMKYKPFLSVSSKIQIHPYLLKEYNNRWFVIGLTKEHKNFGVHALDRIESLSESIIKFKQPNRIQLNNYFKDIIGVTNNMDSELEEIIIRISRYRAEYLKTKPIHESQKILAENDDFIRFSFKLKLNKELTALLLEFGKDLIIEKPESLITEFKNIYNQALKNYS